MEVAKTRAALSAQGQYRSLAHCMRNCVKHEGVGALYKGLLASLVGIVPYSGVDLALYSLLTDTYAAHFPDSEPGVLTLLACGSTATTCAQLVSYPLQLVRTRLQAQGMEGRPVIYNGIVDCVAKTVNTEGIRGLYRGILPNFMVSAGRLKGAHGLIDRSACAPRLPHRHRSYRACRSRYRRWPSRTRPTRCASAF